MQWWLVFLAVSVLFLVLEWRWPAEQGHGLRGRLRNIGFSLLFVVFGSFCVQLTLGLTQGFTRELVPFSGWLRSFGSIVATLFIGDCIYYWYHRAQHRFSPLWMLHELHHADDQLNATTSRRTYFLEKPVQFLIIVLPSLLLVQSVPFLSFARMDPVGLSLYPYIAILWLVFTHANIRLSFGRFTVVATGPQYHRIHHSVEPAHIDKNFAQFFPVLDRLFGTYAHPAPNEFPKTGTPHLAADARIIETQLRPFKQWLNAFKSGNS